MLRNGHNRRRSITPICNFTLIFVIRKTKLFLGNIYDSRPSALLPLFLIRRRFPVSVNRVRRKMGSSPLLTHESPKIIYCSKSRPLRTEFLGAWHMLKGMGMFALCCLRRWRAMRYVLSGNLFDK